MLSNKYDTIFASSKENNWTRRQRISGNKTMNAKIIFNEIENINPSTSIVSSLGSYVNPIEQQIADSKRAEILGFIPEGTFLPAHPETKKTILKKPTVDRAQFTDQIIPNGCCTVNERVALKHHVIEITISFIRLFLLLAERL